MSGRKAGHWTRAADGAILGGLLAAGIAGCLAAAVFRRAAIEAAPPSPDLHRILHRVDLATAGETELRILPGVGPRLAERIAAERTAGGAFDSLGDLDRRVEGVGPATVRRWEGRVVVPGSGR